MSAGRPSAYSDELAERICHHIMDGKSFVQIGDMDDMPSRYTIHRWQQDNSEFATKCARAREAQAEFMDHKIMEAADACTPENAAAARVKISAYQWRAGKLAPKKYGDKVALTGADGESPVSVVTTIERRIVRVGDVRSGD